MKNTKRAAAILVLIAAFSNVSQAQTLPDLSGVQLWAQNCGNCHTPQSGDRYAADWWDTIIAHMKIQARLTDAEAEAIVTFLKSGARTASMAQPPHAAARPTYTTAHATPTGPSAAAVEDNQGVSAIVLRSPEATFAAQCAPCHGAKGKGNGPAAVAFNPKPANFTDGEFMASRTDDQLRESITKGIRAMPPFEASLTPEQITEILAFLRDFSK